MSAERLTPEQEKLWLQISMLLSQAYGLVGQAELLLILELKITEGRAFEALNKAEEALNGLSYMFHPQQEWTGGDSSDPKNFVTRPPHIAR